MECANHQCGSPKFVDLSGELLAHTLGNGPALHQIARDDSPLLLDYMIVCPACFQTVMD